MRGRGHGQSSCGALGTTRDFLAAVLDLEVGGALEALADEGLALEVWKGLLILGDVGSGTVDALTVVGEGNLAGE